MFQVEGFQALGGTGALRLGAAFLKNVLGYDVAYISSPTWGERLKLYQIIYLGIIFKNNLGALRQNIITSKTALCEFFFSSSKCDFKCEGNTAYTV